MGQKRPIILSIDDQISAPKIRSLLLERAGYEVIACTSPAVAD